MDVRFLGISGSLRQHSTNRGLLRAAMANLPNGVDMECADLTDIPLFNADIIDKTDALRRVTEQIDSADALVFACAEYNYSIAPALKNILDWASTEPGNSLLAGKPVAIMGAGGKMGSSRAQYHLRQVCVFLDLRPINKPEIFSYAGSEQYNSEGDVVDRSLIALVTEQMLRLAEMC